VGEDDDVRPLRGTGEPVEACGQIIRRGDFDLDAGLGLEASTDLGHAIEPLVLIDPDQQLVAFERKGVPRQAEQKKRKHCGVEQSDHGCLLA